MQAYSYNQRNSLMKIYNETDFRPAQKKNGNLFQEKHNKTRISKRVL